MELDFYTLGRWLGVVSFFALGILIFSGDTARIFDRFWGLDKIIKFQRKFAVFLGLVLLTHPLFFILNSLGTRFGPGYFLLPDFAVPSLALGIVSFYLIHLIIIASALYKRISYFWWQIIHIITYLVYFATLYHLINQGRLYADSLIFQIAVIVLTILVIIGIIYRTSYKISQLVNGKFLVAKVTKETLNTFSLWIRPKNPFSFKAGQFCFLRIKNQRLFARHPFSLASSPEEKLLRFTIKDTGRFTKVAQKLKPDTKIFVEGPYGIFSPSKSCKHLVCLAGGVGITPFLSLIKDNFQEQKKINLLYSARNKSELVFYSELKQIEAPWLESTFFTTREENQDTVTSRIDAEAIKKIDYDKRDTEFLICGPHPFIRQMKKILSELKIPKSQTKVEDFFW